MGIIKKQTIQNSIINYFGIILGYVNVSVLFPKILSMEEFGLTRVLLSLGLIYAQFSSLGIPRTILKFFPVFKTDDRKHQGFFIVITIVPLIGFLLISLLYTVFQEGIFLYYKDKSPLFIQYYSLGAVISFFMLYCTVLETYLSAVFKTILQNIFRTVVLRVIWCVEVILFHYQWITFDVFIISFVLAYAFNLALLIAYAVYLKQISFHWSAHFYKKQRLRKQMIHYALFSIIAGATFILVANIDQLMLASYLGLEAVSIYALAMYISSVMYIPMNSLASIAFPVISKLWRERNLTEIHSVYQKSCVNLFLAGSFVFLMIWTSIDEYISILPGEYAGLKYVALFLGVGKIFDMATGLNTHIIAVSKFYRFETYSAVLLCALMVFTNFWLIPMYQINGAAIATSITLVVYNSVRLVFLYRSFGFISFTWPILLKSILVFILPMISTFFLPVYSNLFISVFYKSCVVGFIFLALLLLLKPSKDIQIIVDKVQMQIFKRIII